MFNFYCYLFLLCAISYPSQAFETSYLSLSPPPRWECKNKQSEWLCRSTEPLVSKQAYLRIQAKLRNASDSTESYLNLLRQPLTRRGLNNTIDMSKVYGAEIRPIHSHPWVVASHLGSEAKNYFTQYYVTTQGDLSILVEFTFHKSKYSYFAPISEHLEKSFRLKSNIAAQAKPIIISQPVTKSSNSLLLSESDQGPSGNSMLSTVIWILAAGVLLLFGLYFLL